jgi:hypothetical protein
MRFHVAKAKKLDSLGRDCTNWGGPRPNSGRPSLGRKRWLVRIRPESITAIKAAARRAKLTAGEFLESQFPG